MPKHRHRWRLSGHNMRILRFVCNCGKTFSRDVTPKELKRLVQRSENVFKHAAKRHKLWEKVSKKIIVPNGCRPRTPTNYKSLFTKEGYHLMEYMRWLQRTNPELISARCDDRHFMNSDLWFIPHEADGEFMGVTMLVVPQCNDEPLKMFLYPAHINGLIEVLKKFKNKKNTYKRPKLDIKFTPEV
jgi:hypothetical protein